MNFLVHKSLFLKASSGEHCVPHNFVFLVALGGTRVCLIVYLVVVPNKIDYGKINVETNSAAVTRTTSIK